MKKIVLLFSLFFSLHELSAAEKKGQEMEIYGSARFNFKALEDRVLVPGFISSSAVASLGKIVGPVGANSNYRHGDTVYIRWFGPSLPGPGRRFAIYTPAVVLQNRIDPTDFSVRNQPLPHQEDVLDRHHRLAGYFYEPAGVLKVVKVEQGLVYAFIEKLNAVVKAGDEIMNLLPHVAKVEPTVSGVPLSAAIVAGSPPSRITASKKSYVYINRGARDGIRIGRVFQAVETLQLTESAGLAAPDVATGEAMVVYVSDSYSTAIITHDFDLIRIGSLLKTKDPSNPIPTKQVFGGIAKPVSGNDSARILEVPDLETEKEKVDPTLPDPSKEKPKAEPPLSELDALERSMQLKSLSAEEKTKLSKLSKQEKVEETVDLGADELEGAPSVAPVDSSFGQKKKPVKKAKTPKANDEEELNLLMMEN